MKKVLFITYYFPPSGGSGVQRPTKFIKYLRDFNVEPIVYTVENGEFPSIDKTLLKDIPDDLTVLKKPIIEPYSIFKLLTGSKKKVANNVFGTLVWSNNVFGTLVWS